MRKGKGLKIILKLNDIILIFKFISFSNSRNVVLYHHTGLNES